MIRMVAVGETELDALALGDRPVAVRIMAWRVDGSALLVNERGRGAILVDLQSGQATPLPDLGTIAGAVLLR